MKRTMVRFSGMVLLAVLFGAAVALADEGGGPCKADREKYCAGLKPGKGLGKCMRENKDKLSPECRAKTEEREAKMREKHPCMADREKFCSGMSGKEAHECMKKNESGLSEGCKAKMKERREKRKARKEGKKGAE